MVSFTRSMFAGSASKRQRRTHATANSESQKSKDKPPLLQTPTRVPSPPPPPLRYKKTTGLPLHAPQDAQEAAEAARRGQVPSEKEQLVHVPHGPAAGEIRPDGGGVGGDSRHFQRDRLQGEWLFLQCTTRSRRVLVNMLGTHVRASDLPQHLQRLLSQLAPSSNLPLDRSA